MLNGCFRKQQPLSGLDLIRVVWGICIAANWIDGLPAEQQGCAGTNDSPVTQGADGIPECIDAHEVEWRRAQRIKLSFVTRERRIQRGHGGAVLDRNCHL